MDVATFAPKGLWESTCVAYGGMLWAARATHALSKPFEIMAVLREAQFATVLEALPKPSSVAELRSVPLGRRGFQGHLAARKILTVRYAAERREDACQARNSYGN